MCGNRRGSIVKKLLFMMMLCPMLAIAQTDYQCLNNCILANGGNEMSTIMCKSECKQFDSYGINVSSKGAEYQCYNSCIQYYGDDELNKVSCRASCGDY